MCDYSLHHLASRPAKVGDKLVTTSFRGTITHGFSSVEDPDVAVCLLPGTEIAFDGEVKRQGLFRWKKTDQKTAIFRKVDPDRPNAYHDALEFPDGEIVMLTQLGEGMRATVLQLPASPRAEERTEEPQKAAFVG